MAEASASASGRLSADDWVRAAFELMADEGIGAVKIPRLCERLGVTKGSFYWHFEDLGSFHGELARRWAEERVRRSVRTDAAADPETMMLNAMDAFAQPRNRNLTRAMRDWAQHDDRARAAIRDADQASFVRLKGAMADLGFDDDEAEVRAKMLYYTAIGFAHVGSLGKRPSARDQLVATWEILTRR